MRISPLIIFICVTCIHTFSFAQFIFDDFSDGSIRSAPEWYGDLEHFIINADSLLQLNYQLDSLQAVYLSTNAPTTAAGRYEWRFRLKLDFAPSATNKFRFYLFSEAQDLSQNSYFIEIGENGSQDALHFYRKHNDGPEELIASADLPSFSSAFDKKVKIVLEDSINWNFYQTDFTENDYQLELSCNERISNIMPYIGLQAFFSATRSDKFYWDDIYAGQIQKDTIPPSILKHAYISANQISMHFNEAVKPYEEPGSNVFFEDSTIRVHQISYFNDSLVLLLNKPLVSGQDYQLKFKNLQDLSGNVVDTLRYSFHYFELEEALSGDIIINEFLPDPNPSVGLPNAEFIELFNKSDKYISVKDFFITDSNTRGLLPDFILKPKSYVTICPPEQYQQYTSFGEALALNRWPSLNNAGDHIILMNSKQQVIDSLTYDSGWYKDDDKQQGGYSIERINPDLPCLSEANYSASIAAEGGTPSKENSIADAEFTGEPLTISNIAVLNDSSLAIDFSASLDKYQDFKERIHFSFDVLIDSAQIRNDTVLIITLDKNIHPFQKHRLFANQITDCNGNLLKEAVIEFYYDNKPPVLEEVIFLSDSLSILLFDEKIMTSKNTYFKLDSTEVSFYQLDSVSIVINNPHSNHKGNQEYQLEIIGLADLYSNQIDQPYSRQINGKVLTTPTFNQLIITELMIDAENNQILPESQYIELYNPTDEILPLIKLLITDQKDTASIPIGFIYPQEYLILVPDNQDQYYLNYGRAYGLKNFPYLNKSSDRIHILNHERRLIHDLHYDLKDYEETIGKSLEIVDLKNPCLGLLNWMYSQQPLGGTPGQINSISEVMLSSIEVKLDQIVAIDSLFVKLKFTDKLNLNSISKQSFEIKPFIEVDSFYTVMSDEIWLSLEQPLQQGEEYSLIISELLSCDESSRINAEFTFALPLEPKENDVQLTEILFNPLASGADFIELYNTSSKFINLKNWIIKSENQSSILFPDKDFILHPKSYVALTEKPELLKEQYSLTIDTSAIFFNELPAFPNVEGVCAIYTKHDSLITKFHYHEDMHLPFLRSNEGVSLEKINFSRINSTDNWRSCSEHAGFATPGTENSQMKLDTENSSSFTVFPSTFSPNHSERSFTSLQYNFNAINNYIASIDIYSIEGMLIKNLISNVSLSVSGHFRWDGDDESGRKVNPGYYVFYIQLLDTSSLKTYEIVKKVAVGY